MNVAWSRFLRSAYRKEPVVSFVLTIGLVDAVIGGFDGSWSLTTVGLGTVGVALATRWWMTRRSPDEQPEQVPQYYLPPQSSRPQLPLMTSSKKRK